MVEPRRTTARIGVLVPFTNTNLEPDLALLSPPEVSLHATRLGGYDASEVPDASQMADLGSSDIQEPLRLLAGIDPNVVLYGCTSATLALGPEAYGEFVDDTGTGAFDLVRMGRTVVLRTFSKAYGLAAARVGWGLFPNEVAQQVRKVLNPNNVSTLSQRAAEAAVRDHSYMRETCLMTSTIRNCFSDALRELGFSAPKSTTNFVLIPFETPDEAASADRLLRSKGILMRNMRGYGLPQCLRATIASQQTMDTVIDALSTNNFRERKHG